MKQIIGVIASFVVGYLVFTLFSIRVGVHPHGWRVSAAERFLHHVIDVCYSGDDGQRTKFMLCAEKQFLPGVRRWGIGPLMEALEKRRLSQPSRAITQCHDLSHAIGAAGVIVSNNLNTALPECTNTCVYGCQHGAVSAWYLLGKDIVNNLPDMCTKGINWSKNPQGRGGCFHELGHAVASVAGYDIVKSLRYCDEVVDVGRIDCGSGVFMELFEPATFVDNPLPLPSNHPDWCKDLWAPYKELCFHQAGAFVYGKLQNEQRALATCLMVPGEYQEGCFRNLGTNIFYVYQYQPQQASAIVGFCTEAGDKWFYPCIFGSLFSSVLSNPQASEGILVCEALQSTQKQRCFGMLGEILEERRTQAEKAVICGSVQDKNNRSICLDSQIHLK